MIQIRSIIWSTGTIFFLTACLFSGKEPASKPPAEYHIAWLGVFPDGDSVSTASAINNRGQVVGYSRTRLGNSPWLIGRMPFLWEGDSLIRLTMLNADDSGEAKDINDSGTIAGMNWKSGVAIGLRWTGRLPVALPPPADPRLHQVVWGIDKAGKTVGFQTKLDFFGDQSNRVPMVWDSTATSIDSVLEAMAYCINEAGRIFGGARIVNGYFRAYRWDTAGVALDADTGATESQALGIDGSGRRVVGAKGTRQRHHAMLWDSDLMEDLGDLPGGFDRSQALAVNGTGQIVGFGHSENGQRAVIWKNRAPVDLNRLVDVPPGLTLRTARDINEAGVIVGEGIGPHGWQEAYVLTPLP